MEFHPLANIFPLLSGDEYLALVEDIRQSGLLEPIWLHEGKILDGRNRYMACQTLGIEAATRQWGGEAGSPVDFVLSLNLARRHMDSSQRAACAVAALPFLEEEARKRHAELAGRSVGNGGNNSTVSEKSEAGKSRGQAAATFGTNPRYVSDAKKLSQESPEIFERVRAGEITIPQAKRQITSQAVAEPLPPRKNGKPPRLIVGRAETMTEIEDKSIDIIITSPPYNLGHADWPMGGGGRIPRKDGIGYTDDMPETRYQRWQLACLGEMYRVARDGASLFYNHKVRVERGHAIHPMMWVGDKRNPWVLRQEIIWDRGSTHNHNKSLFWPHDERIYWMVKGHRPALPNRSVRDTTIWRFHGPVAHTWHPAPFPPELPRRCLMAVGDEGAVVLDPFAGSCTTLKVAIEEFGYAAIGVDTSEEYLERAKRENGWTLKSGN